MKIAILIVDLLAALLLSKSAYSDPCFTTTSIRMCAMKTFDPDDLMTPLTYNPIEMHLVRIQGEINLSAPKEFSIKGNDNALFKGFFIVEACVKSIEDGFFRTLDRNNSVLERIVFKNISCLSRLSTKNFNGIGKFLKFLTFEVMGDLVEIEEDFFDQFVVLESLTIAETRITILPERILIKMPRLERLYIHKNRLTTLPRIPGDRKDLIDKIQAHNNPFDCQCSLQPSVTEMKSMLRPESYTCATPEKFKGQPVVKVSLCSISIVTTDMVQKIQLKVGHNQDGKTVSKAAVRIEIIIAASLVVLLVVIVVIAVVLWKRHKQPKKQKAAYGPTSPSKIIYQNDVDHKTPIMYKYDA